MRLRLAQVVWLVCVVAALFLAVGALLIALDAATAQRPGEVRPRRRRQLDLGVFDRTTAIQAVHGKNAETKNALLNWGLAAVAG